MSDILGLSSNLVQQLVKAVLPVSAGFAEEDRPTAAEGQRAVRIHYAAVARDSLPIGLHVHLLDVCSEFVQRLAVREKRV